MHFTIKAPALSVSSALRAGAGRRTPAVANMALPNSTDTESFNFEVIDDSINGTNLSYTSFENIALTLNIYYTPVLIVLGCVGNALSIAVFSKPKLKSRSTSQYLSALAVSDTLFLCQLLPPWLKAVGASDLFAQHGYCQLFVYLSYVTSNVSSWLVVAFTVERFVAVVHPLRSNVMCTVKRARHIIVSLTVSALLLNLPVLWFAVPSGNECNIDAPLIAHAARFNILDTMVSFTLPLAVIMVLNTWITWNVYRLARTRGHLMRRAPAPPPPPAPARARPPLRNTCQRSQQRVTRMLLIVSSVFVLLNVPAYAMRILAYANDMDEHEYSGKWAALQQICLLFFNTNFGINFVLYCMTGQNFRRALLDSFPWLRRRQAAAMRDNTDRPARASSISTSFVHSLSNPHAEENVACHRAGGGQDEAGPSGLGQRREDQPGPGRPNPASWFRYRRRREPRVIQRWRFDNRPRGRAGGDIQMHCLPPCAGHM